MKEFNLLKGYPAPKTPRLVGKNLRSITSRLIASQRDKEFFDGDRKGGLQRTMQPSPVVRGGAEKSI